MSNIAQLMFNAAAGANIGNPWDISYAVYNGAPVNWFHVGSQETAPQGVFFKPDGTKMYVTGSGGDDVNEYSLSTAWDVSTASYVQNFSVSSQAPAPRGLSFKDDGTEMYVVCSSNDVVYQYSLSTAWDISTASYVDYQNVAPQDSAPTGLFFKDDGTTMYITGSNADKVYQYSLSTAWVISTASYVRFLDVSAQDGAPQDLFFRGNGRTMYVTGNAGGVYQYSLSSAWNVDTASYVQTFSVTSETPAPKDLFFTDDGTEMYVLGGGSDNAVHRYSLSTAWDISTASFTYPSTDYFSVANEHTTPTGLFLKPDGTKMYVTGSVGDDVNEYSLSTAWDISTASYTQNFSVASQETAPQDLFFKPDGTKMYVTGSVGDAVYEYSLSTAWDVSTTSYVQNFSVASEDTIPRGLFFKDDGTAMYVVGDAGSDVYEYSLSTAWDISTASYTQNFSVTGQGTAPQALFFKPDGTNMYVIDENVDNVNEYSLSTAWDISTASYVQDLSVAAQDSNPYGLFFKNDGTKMYVIGEDRSAVLSYDL
jgi:DNA-binding beta-propeller fold protein YncE